MEKHFYIDGLQFEENGLRLYFTNIETGEYNTHQFKAPMEVLEHFRGSLGECDTHIILNAIIKWLNCAIATWENITEDVTNELREELTCVLMFESELADCLMFGEVQDHD